MTTPTAWAKSKLGLVVCKAETIGRDNADGKEESYLWRFNVIKCRWFGVMLHRFYRGDDDCLHDHPWPFISIILWGGYKEYVGDSPFYQTWNGDYLHRQIRGTWYRPGSILFRAAGYAHRIEIQPEQRGRVWTLVLTGPRWREWGFFTKYGWLPWRRYSRVRHCD